MKNNKLIVLLTGEIATGKSTLAQNLSKFDFKRLSTRLPLEYFAKKSGIKIENRAALQKLGESLDKNTRGQWVRDFFQQEMIDNERVVIDSVRIEEQIHAFRNAYGPRVVHVHLLASEEALKQRFINRDGSKFASDSELNKAYKKFKQDNTEANVYRLKANADLVIATDKKVPDDILIQVAGFLKVLCPTNIPLVDVVVGAQFGSEGKGQIVGHLAPEYDCLVRVGGPNAGHKVYNEPNHDVFHILPSGATKNPNAKLIIGPGAVVSLETILDEIRKFNIDDPKRLLIDQNATIITASDIKLENKLDRIGSTKQGVGAATANNILGRLKESKIHKAEGQRQLKQYLGSAQEELEKIFSRGQKVLLEGTQGTFLSLYHGFYPHVTSRDTTVAGCLSEAGIAPKRVRKIVMVTRTYPIRVKNPSEGTSGPFTNRELTWEEIAERSQVPISELKQTEMTTTTKKERRVAEFSFLAFRRACELNSPTDIALTFVDYLSVKNQKARRFDLLTSGTTQFIEEVERCAGVPVSLISTRFSFRSVIDRRNWI